MANQTNAVSKQPISISGRNLGSVLRDVFYQYAVNMTFGAAGTDTFTPVIPIQSDAHFLCVQTMYSNQAEIATAAIPFANVLHGGALVQLSDGASQRYLQNQQVPLNTLFGSAKEPYIWPFTHLFRANGYIGINITGVGAVMAAMNLRLVFGGFKVPIGSFPELGL